MSLKFAFEDPEATAGLPVASCLMVRAPIGEPDDVEDGHLTDVVRPYTPISEPDSKCAPSLRAPPALPPPSLLPARTPRGDAEVARGQSVIKV